MNAPCAIIALHHRAVLRRYPDVDHMSEQLELLDRMRDAALRAEFEKRVAEERGMRTTFTADVQMTSTGSDIIERLDLMGLAHRVERGEVKALSIRQPYPHHIFHDGKDVENRDWPTKGRGWFIVHAGVSKTELDMTDPKEAAMPRGGVVGMARIVDCVTAMDSMWFNGTYGFVLRDAFPLPLILCKGALSFFALPPDILAIVANSIRARAAQGAE